MEQYNVTGMSCAACSARVEKAVSAVPGVKSCAVSLLTNSMGVEGNASETDIIRAVENAGYGASKKGKSAKTAVSDDDILKDTETPKLKKRLIRSVAVLLVLMYFSMGHMMWGFPAPAVFDNYVFLGVFEMLLAIVIMMINAKFFTNGFKSLFSGHPNMDTLVALGSSASFGYSLAELFIMIIALGNGEHELVMKYGMNLYFESAAMIPTLITVGKMLESMSKGRTTDALKGLMKLAPKTAVLYRDGEEHEVGIEEVRLGDIFAVKPGESIPVDGVVVFGSSSVDESALTGESIPVDKEEGASVSAATINRSGYIRCRATRVGEDTTLSQIIKTVSDAAATKAPIARIADKVSGIFVPAVMTISILTLVGWLIAGKEFSFAIARAISVLVISCPCALGLATPVAIMVGSGVGAKNGILYKTAASLEAVGRADIVTLDKTGTITEGKPDVTDIIPFGITDNELLRYAAALEAKSEHPLAKAIMGRAEDINVPEVSDFKALVGNGLSAVLDGEALVGGSYKYISQKYEISSDYTAKVTGLSEEGKTPLLFAKGDKFIGMIAVADTIKSDSAAAIEELKGMGINVFMLTGDNERTALAIGRQAHVDNVIAGVLPDGKSKKVSELKSKGKVIMVGDGINDAPALTTADTGIAIGAGADVAIDAADIVVMKNRLTDVSAAIRLSRATIRNIHENLFWAFIYNAVCIPLAIGLFGIEMKPAYGAAAMAMSSFCVCMNALRLNLVKIHDASRDKKLKKKKFKTEEKEMTKTLKIEGMMCGHCEARVKKTLEAIEGIESAAPDHNTNTAVITLSKDVDIDVIKAAIEAQDYKFLGVE
ncbi:MAG: heavy metal translocating P-type ATPase [Lachnospiraceae bacterium]|nr:heavy metal translocating P-type ATPase [Lachnospiraceae bacterium]